LRREVEKCDNDRSRKLRRDVVEKGEDG